MHGNEPVSTTQEMYLKVLYHLTEEEKKPIGRVRDIAHELGVNHRDLTPQNIHDGAPGEPNVLDVGVARATKDAGDDAELAPSFATAGGQLVGTLHYMSPEQVAGDSQDLDTRSDVYALGVILYELLAGRAPYELSRRSMAEAARIISHEEPVRLGAFDRAFRGDLETIASKALEKERTRRYASASDLALDVQIGRAHV